MDTDIVKPVHIICQFKFMFIKVVECIIHIQFTGTVVAVAGIENADYGIFKFTVIFSGFSLVIYKTSWYTKFSAHSADTVLMSVGENYFDFRAIISAACFKISASISSSFTRFLSSISSFSSGVLLSFALNDPELLKSLTHFVTVDFPIPYSSAPVLDDFPFFTSKTI